ncbi:unnamed protein product [Ranitomeya imitator]|uniref:GAE domain-containing protein n=1 Tax=Ranitomeya imitator TaxID=111125 RepID=A0ABN9LWL5_9NEOB|nr:unnamed protein product [Ranitomeya imitator]
MEKPEASEVTELSTSLPTLIDLAGFEPTSPPEGPKLLSDVAEQPSALIPILPPPPLIPAQSRHCSSLDSLAHMNSATNSLYLLDEELLHLGIDDPPSNTAKELCPSSKVEGKEIDFFTGPSMDPLTSTVTPLLAQPVIPMGSINSYSSAATYTTVFSTAPTTVPMTALPTGGIKLHELEVLGQQLLEEAKGASAKSATVPSTMTTLAALQPANAFGAVVSASSLGSLPVAPSSPLFLPHQESPQKGSYISLTNVTVPLESIRPSSLLPLTAYDKNGFRILLHFAKDCPPDRPDVLVVIISMINTAPLPIQKILFQAAVPKTMKVKLQPASGTDLAAFNPILPPASITQVMLLANPLKISETFHRSGVKYVLSILKEKGSNMCEISTDKVRLRYKLSFALGEECSTETVILNIFSNSYYREFLGRFIGRARNQGCKLLPPGENRSDVDPEKYIFE